MTIKFPVCGKCGSKQLYRDNDYIAGCFFIACRICGNRYPGGIKPAIKVENRKEEVVENRKEEVVVVVKTKEKIVNSIGRVRPKRYKISSDDSRKLPRGDDLTKKRPCQRNEIYTIC